MAPFQGLFLIEFFSQIKKNFTLFNETFFHFLGCVKPKLLKIVLHEYFSDEKKFFKKN